LLLQFNPVSLEKLNIIQWFSSHQNCVQNILLLVHHSHQTSIEIEPNLIAIECQCYPYEIEKYQILMAQL